METLKIVCQLVIALGIVNVWILRFGKETIWRGGVARNMTEEFTVYGLPVWFMRTIGALKLSLAALLIAGIWFPALTLPAAVGMAALMLGAIAMHFKVSDPPQRSLPALSMLAMSIVVAVV